MSRMTTYALVRCPRVCPIHLAANIGTELVRAIRPLPRTDISTIRTMTAAESTVTSAAADDVTAPVVTTVARPTHLIPPHQSCAIDEIETALARVGGARKSSRTVRTVCTARAKTQRAHPCPPMRGPPLLSYES